MHVINIPHPIDMGPQGTFPAGRLLMEDRNAAEMMLQFPDAGISMEPYRPMERARLITRILVAGGIGMGDAIMLTPVLRELKAKNPLARLDVACFAHYRPALLNLPYIDGFADWPIELEKVESTYQKIIFLENFGHHPLARTHHQTDVFADICGVELTDRRADYFPTKDEKTWAIETFPRVDGIKRLGLQVQASHRCRTWPAELMRDLMNLMVKDGWEIYLMGAPGEYACQPIGHLHDLRERAPRFRESAAFLLTCDAFCGPDSGFLHAAGAMGVKAVGLFGAFPWKLRTAHYPSVFAIQGAGDCGPCFHSPNRLQPAFPRNGPCARTGRCEVLAGITAERVKGKLLN